MDDLNHTTNRLRRKFDATSNYLETKVHVMDSARRINQVITKGNYGTQAERYWVALRTNNDDLARENDKALTQFLDSGWSGSAQTDAAAKAGKSGAAYSGAPGVWVYQIIKNGIALQITLQGTKYYKHYDLNNK